MPTLYLMLGLPGAGKTTTAKVIHGLTGATHLWADKERQVRFGHPSYTSTESKLLYDAMNKEAETLLKSGNSVIFDTSFNYHHDRDHLREIARKSRAKTVLLWVTVDEQLARSRATHDAHLQDSRIAGDMSDVEFDELKQKLQPPDQNEAYIQLDGTKITSTYIREKLNLTT